MSDIGIEFRNVTKRYGDVIAVSRVSLSISAGSLVTLLGPSGCGKTTMLRLIAGLELPTSGTLSIGGRDVCGRGVGVREDRHRLDAQLAAGSDDANRDLTAVRDEHSSEH